MILRNCLKMNKPKINVLILNWNGEGILNSCIESILTSTYENYSITVIDNGSEDNSINDIDKISNKINIIKIGKNLGYSKGYNFAFNKIKNQDDDYYFLLNNDTVINKDTLEMLYLSLKNFGYNNIYSPKIINSNNDLIWYAGGRMNPLTNLSYHIGINSNEDIVKYKTSVTDFVSGCAMLIEKSLVDSLNGFNEAFNFYYEDIDLCLRAKKKANVKCIFVNDSKVYHKISKSMGGRFSFTKIYYKIISSIKFLYINNNFLMFIFYLLINIIVLPFRFIFRILNLILL